MTVEKDLYCPPEFSHWPSAWGYTPVVEAQGLVFLSGFTGTRGDGSIADEPHAQFQDVFNRLDSYLASADLTHDAIVDVSTFHVRLREFFSVFDAVKRERLPRHDYAWTAVGVDALINPAALLEMKVVATRA